jgi:TolB-like protein
LKRSLFAELKRRNVFRAAILYAGAVWALAQGISQLGPSVGLPEWTTRWFLVAAVIGFPFWVAFAWFFEFTPEGIKRERDVEPGESITHHTGRKLDFIIIGVMAVAIVLLVTDRFVLHHGVNEEAAVPEQSIAVLPFVNMSSDKEQEYFSDGISEELLNLLAKLPALHVAARTSSFSFKGKEVPIREIAKTLLVANVLEGSVRKSGDQVRITAQLIRASDGYHVWSETWDRKLDDIFKIQDEIAGKVVDELKVTLLGDAPKARTTDPRAYALYLQARELGRQFTAEALAKSDALYHQVLAIDPRYAPGWDGLATNFVNETIIGVLSNQEGLTRSREAAEKALAIDPDYAPAHAVLSRIALTYDNDLPGAAKHFERALGLDPTNLDVLRNAALFLNELGRLDEALALSEALVRRDPVNAIVIFNLGIVQIYARRYDAAIASFRTVLNLSPGRAEAHYELAEAQLLKGDAAGALTEMGQETSENWRMVGLPMVYHAVGRGSDSAAALSALIGKYEKDCPFNIAYTYAFRGEADKAFAWLDKAIEYQDPGIGDIVVENLFDNIHTDPRWLPFLRKIGRAPEQLAKIEFKVTLPKEWQAETMTASSGAKP